MNDNLPPDKVKDTLPFPGSSSFVERIDRLEDTVSTLLNTVAKLQASIAGRESRPEIKAPVEVPSAPESRPLPEEDKTISRIALCSELVRLVIELGREMLLGASPTLAPGDKAGKPRVHFMEDNSFIYFDKTGRIHEGRSEKKSPVARWVLKTLYSMRDHLPSPIIQAALLKSQFNAAVLE
jgi:hypothetical protein